jgi:GAF domain-containing protein
MPRKKPVPLRARVEALEKKLAREVAKRKRVEKALAESAARQTATSEILRIISDSPADVQPVFDAIVRSAVMLCDGFYSVLLTSDGERVHIRATHNFSPEARREVDRVYPMSIRDGSTVIVQAVRERRIVQVADLQQDPEVSVARRERAVVVGHRTYMAVPMLREGRAVGAIAVSRREVKLFSAGEIALFQTFADQAVIAIENVRLFTELEARNRALTTALEQQTATTEVLRVISSSPTDTQPVFNSIIESAVRLCGGWTGAVFTADADRLYLRATFGGARETEEAVRRRFPAPLDRNSLSGRAILDGTLVHVPDVEAPGAAAERARATARLVGFRSALVTPMSRDGRPIGAIFVSRRDPGLFGEEQVRLLRTFADQAVIAIENVRLFTELEARNRDLAEALEQQTATSEILRVISASPTDLQPVFDTIVTNATRLCRGRFGTVNRFDGKLVHLAAHYNLSVEAQEALQRLYPQPPGGESLPALAILHSRVMHVGDVEAEPNMALGSLSMARILGYRSQIVIPMLREGVPIGALSIAREEVGLFPQSQVELLKTFADQAVIAIENVRLFTELEARNREVTEALEQQTATSEILRVISSSPTSLEPVFNAILSNAATLCEANLAMLWRYDGEYLVHGTSYNASPEFVEFIKNSPQRPSREGPGRRAALERRTVHVVDLQADPSFTGRYLHLVEQARTVLAVPLLRESTLVGVIILWRRDVRAFTDKQIALLQTFADQAVIAIENVRLFTELDARNRDLSVSLEQQTATAEILRVISRSGTDVQPVFDAIAESALRLLRGWGALVVRFDGELLHLAAICGGVPGSDQQLRERFPRPVGRGVFSGAAILDREVKQIADIEAEDRWAELRTNASVRGWRAALAVPMLQDGQPIGAINVTRAEPGAFSAQEVELLKTFADQAVIAIENARLLTELQARTQELTRSVGQLTALGEVGQAVSSSLELETVLSTIVARAVQLAGAHAGTIWEYDEPAEEFRLRITHNVDDSELLPRRDAKLKKGEGAVGRLAVTHEPVQIPDIMEEGAYDSRLREVLVGAGTRALLAVPLLRENRVLGGLVMSRRTPGEFPPEVVEVLKTFATQSALAIQNARLFREIEEKGRQLAAASQHKSEFLANMSHELRTPLNAIIGFSEVLGERMFGDINEKQEEYVQDILASGRHLLSLINDILDLSKIEAGRMELEVEEFDLPQAIGNALTLVRERAGRRGIELNETIDERLGTIRGDERKVKQVLLNLLSNALKFTPEGGRIDVRAAVADGTAEISVTDTGVGIAEKDQDAVFEEFRQVGAADKRMEGTGLGLPLARKFVELHGGRLWLKSQVGVGSTFTFTLPLVTS